MQVVIVIVISIHALLAESDLDVCAAAVVFRFISIHALLAESDRFLASLSAVLTISIHALLAESDKHINSRADHVKRFLSTLSLRRATCTAKIRILDNILDFYPRSPCGERPLQLKPPVKTHRQISIHALLAESDVYSMLYNTSSLLFLSTLSLRRATRTEFYAQS